jgi:6-phosphofructokinase 1
MGKLRGSCAIGQSGGPTSAINASVLGCVEAALKSNDVTKVYGAARGIMGLLEGELYDLTIEDPAELARVKHTPSAVLGSCRHKLADPAVDDAEYRLLLDVFGKYDIRHFFYVGGNDSMDTCNKIDTFLARSGYECRVIGIPKTIDNDLALTDHCPGYGSAAKYVATTCMEVGLDAKVYGRGSVTVIEIMGRNAGWLTAACALPGSVGLGPDLIYPPEIPFDPANFVADAERALKRGRDVVIAVSEGVKDKNGDYISSYFSDMSGNRDNFGHAQMGGLAAGLANFVRTNLGVKAKGIELSLMQRCAIHIASAADIGEAYAAGRAAFEAAESGESGKMVSLVRAEGSAYKCGTGLVDLADVANAEKCLPREWINAEGNGMLQAFTDYALPLIRGGIAFETENGLPRFAKLKNVRAEVPPLVRR